MPDHYQFEELKSGSGPDFEEFYNIYADAISARERKSKAWISAMVGKAEYRILLLKLNSHVIGFSVLFLPQSADFGLLEYMATASQYRNKGIGAELFRHSVQAAQSPPSQARSLLLEVDSDRERCPDQVLRKRRQKFYRRLGCLAIAGLPYIMPLAGEGPPPEMDLLIYPADDLRRAAKSQLKIWLKTIYQGVYHCPSDDPRISQMLMSVTDPVEFV